MSKYIYIIFAEIIALIHGIIFISGLLIGLLWQELFWYYTIIFLLGIPSWIFLGRCFVTDLENYLRIKGGQNISHIKKSFLGYWGVKIFGKHGPSNTTIKHLVFAFYIVFTPIWLFTIYNQYF